MLTPHLPNRRRFGVVLLALCALVLSGCVEAGSDVTAADKPKAGADEFLPLLDEGSGEPSQEIQDAAAKEGGLVWYDSSTQEQAAQIMKAFQRKYPFIKEVSHVQLVAGDIATRVVQEDQSGRSTADVVSNAAELMTPLDERGLIAPLEADKLAMPSDLVAGDLAVTSTTAYGIQYNTKLVAAQDVPKTWDDLLDPKWKGKIGLWSLPAPLVNLVPTWGGDETQSFVKSLMAQQPQVFQSVFEMTSAISSGQLPLGIGVDRLTSIAKAQGAPTDFAAADPLSVSVLYSAVVQGGANPNAARLFISWLDSAEGAKAQEDATGRANPQVPGTKVRDEYQGKNLSGWPPGNTDQVKEWADAFTELIQAAG
ncbi:ABC transporter substrate-binding protein [Actinophytocola sp.]|uniref:ABC transporter substrate-binding protein n=1 Tax=Actinophytocola sp. TaxID=1872138 RepID=UPI003D6C2C4F